MEASRQSAPSGSPSGSPELDELADPLLEPELLEPELLDPDESEEPLLLPGGSASVPVPVVVSSTSVVLPSAPVDESSAVSELAA